MVRQVVHLLRSLHINKAANEVNVTHLVSIFSPVLCRPPSGAFMSIRHIKALPHIQLALLTLINNYDLVFRVRWGWALTVQHRSMAHPACGAPVDLVSSQRQRAWSPQAEAESYHNQVVVLAITEELLDDTVNAWFEEDDGGVAPPVQITGEPARWAHSLPSPVKAQQQPAGAGAGVGSGAGAGAGVEAGSAGAREAQFHLSDVDAFHLSDDEDGAGGGRDTSEEKAGGRASSPPSEAKHGGSGGDGAGGSGGTGGTDGDEDADGNGGKAAEGSTSASRGVSRSAAQGLSLSISSDAKTVNAPVSPPTPWVASPNDVAAASTRLEIVEQTRRPSGALRRKQVAEYRKVRCVARAGLGARCLGPVGWFVSASLAAHTAMVAQPPPCEQRASEALRGAVQGTARRAAQGKGPGTGEGVVQPLPPPKAGSPGRIRPPHPDRVPWIPSAQRPPLRCRRRQGRHADAGVGAAAWLWLLRSFRYRPRRVWRQWWRRHCGCR